jgi:hypothetical protein
VDTLYQNYKIDLDTLLSWEPKFTAWKLEAQATKERVLRLDMPGGEYFLAAAGRRNYAYLLTRPGYGELLLTYTEQFRGARVRLYSDWIKGCATFDEVAAGAVALVEGVFGAGSVLVEQVGEIHVAVDVARFAPTVADLTAGRWLCPATLHLEDVDLLAGRVESLRWGKHGSPVSAVCYNKSREIRQQSEHKAYLLDGWRAAGWSETDGDVYRLEFRFSREWLRDCLVNVPGDVDLSALLVAGMEWLSLRDIDLTDTNRSRWAVAAHWSSIQSQAVKLLGDLWKRYKREYVPSVTVHQLAAQIGGCVACVGALTEHDDLDDLFLLVRAVYEQRLEQQGFEFSALVAARSDRYMLPPPAGSAGDHPAGALARQD